MAIKYFCDLGGEEIPEDETYFSVAISANTTGNNRHYDQSRDDRYMVGSDWQEITRSLSMVCRTCTIEIAKTADAKRAEREKLVRSSTYGK